MKMIKTGILFIFSLALLFANTGYFPEDGSGYFFQAEYAKYAGSCLTIHNGYISKYGASLDMIIGLPYITIDDDIRYSQAPLDGEALLGLEAGLPLMQQTRKIPINLSLNTSCKLGVNWNRYGGVSTNRYYQVDAVITRRLEASERITYIPSAGLSFNRKVYTSLYYPYYGIGPTEGSISYRLMSFGLTIMFRHILLSWEMDNPIDMNLSDLLSNTIERSKFGIGFVIPKKHIK